ncbi:hypothetical protein BSL78_28549 [Apostichopus japonicus]|uniref:Uncharacterized protein n=1 Tax=Stichopus japonicus TaxID=307972 RepID=A0A2G8JFW0_STIJA|nr:hypothetical protein BSL78_28549 [Apostichopus japonicus]
MTSFFIYRDGSRSPSRREPYCSDTAYLQLARVLFTTAVCYAFNNGRWIANLRMDLRVGLPLEGASLATMKMPMMRMTIDDDSDIKTMRCLQHHPPEGFSLTNE